MSRKQTIISLLVILMSILTGGVFYFAWMAVVLLTLKPRESHIQSVLWLLAPVVTSLGFAVGAAVAHRLFDKRGVRFTRVYLSALAGCAIGAGSVYWYGPMLIVFGMLLGGTVAIVLREVLWLRRLRRESGG